jgi:arylsulfatase A
MASDERSEGRGAVDGQLDAAPLEGDRPNILVVFTDDQGYGDLGCFGSPYIDTPNVDRMADEGARFTDFQAAPFCTPSRAALMTGSYAARVGLADGVLFPGDNEGLHQDEVTVAEVLSSAGYTTGCIGKWHLGDHHPFLPTDHGFDSYFGIPYSNDMRPDNYHGVDRHPSLPLVRGDEVVKEEPDQSRLTQRYTDETVSFIEEHAGDDEPFFCYLAHAMPHVPLHTTDEFLEESYRGLYGDVIEEIDHGVGRLLETLEREGVADDTLVIYTSDNGPWLQMGHDGGSAGPLRGGKATAYEGGHRVPAVVWWPDVVPEGTVCRELATTMDLLPTLADVAGVPDAVPADRVIDGENIARLLEDPEGAATPRDGFAYFGTGGELRAVRDDAGMKYYPEEDELYDLHEDVGERTDVSDAHPAVVDRLAERFDAIADDLKANGRPVGNEPGEAFTERVE